MAPTCQKGDTRRNNDLQFSTSDFGSNFHVEPINPPPPSIVPKVPSKGQHELSLSLECLTNKSFDSTRVTFPLKNDKMLASKFSFGLVHNLAAVQAQTAYCNRTFINNGEFENFFDIIKIQDKKFDQCLHSGTLSVQVSATLNFFSNPIESVSKFSIASETNPIIPMKVMWEEGLFSDVKIK